MTWKTNKFSKIDYELLNPLEFIAKMPVIESIYDVDLLFLRMFRIGDDVDNTRLRYKRSIDDSQYEFVRVLNDNEARRLKSEPRFPFIVISQETGHPVDDHVRTETINRYDPTEADSVSTNKIADYHEFTYKVKCFTANLDMHRRLSAFLSSVMFTLERGQRSLLVSVKKTDDPMYAANPVASNQYDGTLGNPDNPPTEPFYFNYRDLFVTDHANVPLVEDGKYEFSISYTFRMALHTSDWVTTKSVEQIDTTIDDTTFD